jgi:hypothetical protein
MIPLQPGKQPTEPSTPETVSVLHELDLGQHTLFIYDDGGIDLFVNDECTPLFAGNALRLDSDETYRLFISLQAQFQPPASIQFDHTAKSPAM